MSATILGLMGQKQSGKDTLAGYLVRDHGYRRLAFADTLKRAALRVNPLIISGGHLRLVDLVTSVGWDAAKGRPEVRRFLQEFGLAMREEVGADVWVWPVLEKAEALAVNGVPVVVTDVRFPNEAQALRSLGGHLVRVERPGLADDDEHVSEHAWRRITPAATVENAGAAEDLADAATRLVGLFHSWETPSLYGPEEVPA